MTALRAVAAVLPFQRVAVVGGSMLPTLLPGDRLLVVRTRRLLPGDIVVVRDPRAPQREVVKRLAALPGQAVCVGGRRLAAGPGQLVVLGDAAGSSDSRVYGPVALTALVGRAVYRYAPTERAGPLMRSRPAHSPGRGWRDPRGRPRRRR